MKTDSQRRRFVWTLPDPMFTFVKTKVDKHVCTRTRACLTQSLRIVYIRHTTPLAQFLHGSHAVPCTGPVLLPSTGGSDGIFRQRIVHVQLTSLERVSYCDIRPPHPSLKLFLILRSQQVSCPQLVSRKALGRVSSRHVARVLTTGTSTSTSNSTLRQVPLEEARSPLSAPLPAGSDPWEDEKWTKYKWTIYRGVAYDLTPYLEKHPGGRWLLNLAIGRDATGLFESYHLRPEVAVARLNRLPKLEGFPVEAVPTSPYPNDSPIYNAIR